MGRYGDKRDRDEGKQVHSTVLIVFVVIYDAQIVISCAFKYLLQYLLFFQLFEIPLKL